MFAVHTSGNRNKSIASGLLVKPNIMDYRIPCQHLFNKSQVDGHLVCFDCGFVFHPKKNNETEIIVSFKGKNRQKRELNPRLSEVEAWFNQAKKPDTGIAKIEYSITFDQPTE